MWFDDGRYLSILNKNKKQMGIDILGLLLAVLTIIVAALVLVWLPAIIWSLLGTFSFPFALLIALLILIIGAMLHTALVSNSR